MPRYHFNIHDGISMPDRDGTELRGVAEARIEAVRMAGEILKGDPKQFWSGERWSVDVTDEGGAVLFSLHFSATKPAVAPTL